MGMAFEFTDLDVEAVLERNGIFGTSPELLDEMIDSLHDGMIEKAALYGNDIDEQTNYAHDEIERQLKEDGYIS